MELLCTPDHFVLVDKGRSLVCNRNDGSIRFMSVEDTNNEIFNATCLGVFYGVVGKFQAHQDFEKKLALIQKRKAIGKIYGGHEVYKIQKVALLAILPGDIPDIDLEPCPIHLQISSLSPSNIKRSTESTSLHKTWTNIKSATSSKKPKDKDRLEKKICDEFLRMFNDTSSFYYSLTGDITTSLQRQEEQKTKTPFNDNIPLWRRVDDRFFWNKYMMSELIDSWDVNADPWIIPIIQGFVQIESCTIDTAANDYGSASPSPSNIIPLDRHFQPISSLKEYTMILISRRSRFRAGTRYKRRGVDESGKVANYVETEQVFLHGPHAVSFVQVRGSVPVFWSQPGSRYRPPPRLDRTEAETREAFKAHFDDELSIYKSQVIISLVEQAGRERVICNTYLKHIIELNSPDLTYVAFDFHDYCRGMKFENVSILIDTIHDIIKDMKYCWVDQHGMILEQNSVFRVNCIDCLDRTNIVQTALAKAVMDIQFAKLGLLPPEGELPVSCRRVFQILWANNGDIISRQYAGTAALKGDFTRTGERKFTGVMKDGYNSASRYYMNRFKDEFRQLTIDLMLGNAVPEDISNLSPPPEDKDELDLENSERVRLLIEDTKRILVPESEPVIGGWALIDADPITGDPNQTEMDTIVILTQDCYYVVEYDEQTDRVTSYEKVMLEDLEKIELGPEPSLFKSKHTIMRLHYQVYGQSGYFHSFRNANFRFFNNIVVPIKTDEQAAEALKVICDTMIFALSNKSLNVPFFQGKLEKRKSKAIQCTSSNNCPPSSGGIKRGLFGGIHLDLPSLASMPRNISDGHLVSAGSRAFSHILSPIRGFVGTRNKVPSPAISASSIAPPTQQHSLESVGSNMQHQPMANQPRTFYNMDTSSESDDDSPFTSSNKADPTNFQPQHSNDFTQSSEGSDGEEAGPNGISTPPTVKEEPSLHDTMLESCGILATSSGSNEIVPKPRSTSKRSIDVDDFVIESMRKISGRCAQRNQNFVAGDGVSYKRPDSLYVSLEEEAELEGTYLPHPSVMPEIHICTDALTPTGSSKNDDNLVFKSSRGPSGKLSKSSEDLDRPATTQVTCSSNDVSHLLVQEETSRDADGLSNKMKTSHSESAIQEFSTFHLPNPLSSPIAIKKDLVLSPLSRIAKGVQNLGMNLRHGANHTPITRKPATFRPEDLGISEEQQRKCQTRIIII